VQLAFAVETVAHNFTLLGTRVAGAAAESFVRGEITWFVSNGPVLVSLTAVGGAGMIGVRVDVAVWPKTSVTRYESDVFVPVVALTSATKVTTPVEVLSVYVPSPAIVTTPSASQVVVPGVIRHVDAVLNPTVDVARPLTPVNVVKLTVPPGITVFVCGVATGAGGNPTVGVMVAFAS
jgi:hypothetical protein